MILIRHCFLTVEVYDNEIMYVKGDLVVRGRKSEKARIRGQVYFLGISALFLRSRLIEVKCNPR
jgi:hypothetical protein